MANEWSLPDQSNYQVRILKMELLLLDWVLCTASSLMQTDVEELIEHWTDLRIRIWDSYLSEDQPLGIMLDFSRAEITILLITIPTSYFWGDGVDYGLSLKTKLAEALLGIYTDPTLTAELEAEQKAYSDAKTFATSQLATAKSVLQISTQAADLSATALDQKLAEAQDVMEKTVEEARKKVAEDQVKQQTAEETLTLALEEAEKYAISTDEAQTGNQTPSQTTNVSDS